MIINLIIYEEFLNRRVLALFFILLSEREEDAFIFCRKSDDGVGVACCS